MSYHPRNYARIEINPGDMAEIVGYADFFDDPERKMKCWDINSRLRRATNETVLVLARHKHEKRPSLDMFQVLVMGSIKWVLCSYALPIPVFKK